ncbi:MAG: shikimate kinase [Pseudomonadota bacterium]
MTDVNLIQAFKDAVSILFGEEPNVVFVGMSNIGKTHWSTRLAQSLGMDRIDFDGLIGQSPAMSDLIKDIEGKDEAERMGIFFGMPWTEGFEERQQKFLDAEAAVMNDNANESNAILDLTGSTFLHQQPMDQIAQSGLVIYLEASLEEQEKALDGLLADFEQGPKPVCWGDVKRPENKEELRQQFKELLAYRAKNYAQYADVTVPFDVHKNAKTAEDLMEYVLGQLADENPKIAARTQELGLLLN